MVEIGGLWRLWVVWVVWWKFWDVGSYGRGGLCGGGVVVVSGFSWMVSRLVFGCLTIGIWGMEIGL